MPNEFSRERLAGLLIDPRERLDFEIKNWLDLTGNSDDKATLAKAMIAIANHGGGFIALGLEETGGGVREAQDRANTLDRYNQDIVNGIVQRYCDPSFHCAVHFVPGPENGVFPVIRVPGGHGVPVIARRDSPNGSTLRQNAVYVRKPGPRSEIPRSAQDWKTLLERCVRNQREELISEIRDLIIGAVPQTNHPTREERLQTWMKKSFGRWSSLIDPLPEGIGARFSHGYYNFAYKISGERRHVSMAQLPEVLQRSVVRHTGWPPFWYPTREGIAPYPFDDAVECWLGGDSSEPIELRDPADADFWRISADGFAFLLRGYQEDSEDFRQARVKGGNQGTLFDVHLPIWRVGETLLHAESLAAQLFNGPTTVKFVVMYTGLSGRSLVSHRPRRHVSTGGVSRQTSFRGLTHVDTRPIGSNLPEIVHPLLSPLYELFDFYELRMDFVADELSRMRAR